jgi:integrase
VGDFTAALRAKSDIAARKLEMAILCATRSGETIRATWSEIDWDKRLWMIPKDHIKRDRAPDRSGDVRNPLLVGKKYQRIRPPRSRTSL